jgi:hypothetical protein
VGCRLKRGGSCLYGAAKVEAFWNVVESMRPAHELLSGTTVYLFRTGVLPAWEDPANLNVRTHPP